MQLLCLMQGNAVQDSQCIPESMHVTELYSGLETLIKNNVFQHLEQSIKSTPVGTRETPTIKQKNIL